MHDVLDAQWQLDNMKDGKRVAVIIMLLLVSRVLLEESYQAIGSSTDFTQETSDQRQCCEFIT